MKTKVVIGLVLILCLAAFLRFFHYGLADVITDEVFYGYRSIGLIDSLNSPFQSTPFEWYEAVPAWAKLSFHDHPPLGFWIEHWFFKVFGVNLLTLRLPFILAGIASVLATYFIAKRLFHKEAIALVSAIALAVNTCHIWISRIALQESLVIFFLLLAILLFLKVLEDSRWFYPTVLATGLAILMKYTAGILLPIFLAFLLWKRRDFLTWRRIVGSLVLLLVITSPVIIYNWKLYEARGHFDYQISYLLKQNVPEWQVRMGREVGTWPQKFLNLGTRFWSNFGPLFSTLGALSLLFLFSQLGKQGGQFLLTVLGFLVILILVIGPQERFVSMLSPFLAILVGAFLVYTVPNTKFFWTIMVILVCGELLYVSNTLFFPRPWGLETWSYSRLRLESNTWGYNQLENYLQETMAGFYPAAVFPLRFSFAKDLQKAALEKAKQEGRKPRAIMFVSDSSMFGLASLWYITRHSVYDGWPMITDSTYLEATQGDPAFFRKQGIKEIFFIKAQETLLRPEGPSQAAQTLETQLIQAQKRPIVIASPHHEVAFKVYPVVRE